MNSPHVRYMFFIGCQGVICCPLIRNNCRKHKYLIDFCYGWVHVYFLCHWLYKNNLWQVCFGNDSVAQWLKHWSFIPDCHNLHKLKSLKNWTFSVTDKKYVRSCLVWNLHFLWRHSSQNFYMISFHVQLGTSVFSVFE